MTERHDTPSNSDLESQIKELLANLSGGETASSVDIDTVQSDSLFAVAEVPLPVYAEPRLICTPRKPEHPSRGGEGDTTLYQPVDLILSGRSRRSHPRNCGDDLNDLALDEQPPQPRRQRNPYKVLLGVFRGQMICREDAPAQWVRKGAFWLSLATLFFCLLYGLYAVWLLPLINASRYDEVAAMYLEQGAASAPDDAAYPKGMRPAFRPLYAINEDVRGFVQYHAIGKADFLNIDYPIMRGASVYVDHDFFGNRNKNGTPFFDTRNHVDDAGQQDRVLFIYGQNGLGGQMFSGLNDLVGSVYRARAAATLTVSTLYENSTYQVFAVILTDENETGDSYFYARRTEFKDDADFLAYVDSVRERSLFDYPVDITASDHLVVLSTVASPSVSKLDNSRIMVFARRVTDSASLDTARILKNEEVIMPMAWYINQGLAVHPYYEQAESLPTEEATTTSASTTTVTTSATTETTTTTTMTETTTTTNTTTTTSETTTTTNTTTEE